jgi:putative ATP-dependent endonuclease of OLD family
VEGPSEQLFYKALARAIGIDIDRLNISILIVDGIGFKPYASLLASLQIPLIMRTDNDIFKIPNQEKYRFAGVQRAIEIYRAFYEKNEKLEPLLADKNSLVFDTPTPPQKSLDYTQQVKELLESIGIFMSEVDLENDLYSQLPVVMAEFFGIEDGISIVNEMQKRKATLMFEFLRKCSERLDQLRDSEISKPLKRCQEIAEYIYGTSTDS